MSAGPGNTEPVAAAGKILDGRYELLDVVGRGGTTIVYRARDRMLGRIVAVKLFNAGLPVDARRAAGLKERCRAAIDLHHPHLVSIYDCGSSEDGICYLVMEFMEGQTLAHVTGYTGKIGNERGAVLFSQLCEALACMHERRMVHNNLRPANVFLVRSADGKEVAKLSDPASARLDNPPDSPAYFSAANGDPLYRSPEQALGRKVDQRSDIYSLGRMMLEAFNGKLSILADSRLADYYSTVGQGAKSESTLDAGELPPQLQRIVARALQKEPHARHQSVLDLERELAPLCPVAARRKIPLSLPAIATMAGGALASAARNRKAAVAAAVAALALVAGLIAWYRSTGSGAVQTAEASLALQRLVGPGDDARLLERMNRLVELYGKQGRAADAVRQYKEILSLTERRYGSQSKELAEAYEKLAGLASAAAGDAGLSRVSYGRAITILDALANNASDSRRYDLAEQYYRRALHDRQMIFADGSPELIQSIYHCALLEERLGLIAQDQRRFRIAEALITQDMRMRASDGRPYSPRLVDMVQELGNLYVRQRDFLKASRVFRRALAIRSRQPLTENRVRLDELLEKMTFVADELYRQSRLEQARQTYLDVLPVQQKLGLHKPRVGNIYYMLGNIAQSKGNAAEAEPLYKRALAILQKERGPGDSGVAASSQALALCELKLGRYAEARRYFSLAVTTCEEGGIPLNKQCADGYEAFGRALEHAGRAAEGRNLREQGRKITAKEVVN